MAITPESMPWLTNLEAIVFCQEPLRLLLGSSDFGMRRQVDISLLLDPSQALPGRPLEEAILLILVQTLLLRGPVLQYSILLSQQLFQDY